MERVAYRGRSKGLVILIVLALALLAIAVILVPGLLSSANTGHVQFVCIGQYSSTGECTGVQIIDWIHQLCHLLCGGP